MIVDVNDPNWHIYLYDDHKSVHVHFQNVETEQRVEIQNAHLLLKGLLKPTGNETELV
jgi:hypothetical protein